MRWLLTDTGVRHKSPLPRIKLNLCSRANPVDEVIPTDHSVESLININTGVTAVPQHFEDQEVPPPPPPPPSRPSPPVLQQPNDGVYLLRTQAKTETQAQRLETEAEAKAGAKAEAERGAAAEAAAAPPPAAAATGRQRGGGQPAGKGHCCRALVANPIVRFNVAGLALATVVLGVGACRRHQSGTLSWKLAGTWVFGMVALAGADLCLSSFLAKKYPLPKKDE